MKRLFICLSLISIAILGKNQTLIFQDAPNQFQILASIDDGQKYLAITSFSILVVWDINKNYPILERKLEYSPKKLLFSPTGDSLFLFQNDLPYNIDDSNVYSSYDFPNRHNVLNIIDLKNSNESGGIVKTNYFVDISSDGKFIIKYFKNDGNIDVVLQSFITGDTLLSFTEFEKPYNDIEVLPKEFKLKQTHYETTDFGKFNKGGQNSLSIENNVALIGVDGVIKSWDLVTKKMICRYDHLRIINKEEEKSFFERIKMYKLSDFAINMDIDTYLTRRYFRSKFDLINNYIVFYSSDIIEYWNINDGDIEKVDATFDLIYEYPHTVDYIHITKDSKPINITKSRIVENIRPLNKNLYISLINNRICIGEIDSLDQIHLEPSGISAALSNPKIINEDFLLSTDNSAVRIWDLSTGKLSLSIFFRETFSMQVASTDYKLAFIRQDGYFDLSSLSSINNLKWVFEDDKFRPLPLEIFMRDLYYPLLLRKTLNKTFHPTNIKDFNTLNRVLPKIDIENVGQVNDSIIEIHLTAKSIIEKEQQSGLYDIHIFRNDRLIKRIPDKATSDLKEIPSWRRSMSLPSTFDTIIRISVPRNQESSSQNISAYAFNSDRVKSVTTRTTFLGMTENIKKGRFVVLAIGVQENLVREKRLNHSQGDAEYFSNKIKDVVNLDVYKSVITLKAISQPFNSIFLTPEENYIDPTKENLELVFNVLAGRRKELNLNQQHIVKIAPEDILVVFFSGHGITDNLGNFYLVPSNYDRDDPFNSSISSLELNDWMRNINAEQIYLCIDACYSGGIVSEEYKPGPFGDSDFGQFSYDKRAPILAATQSIDNIASSQNGQGLISHSLFTQSNLVNSFNLYDLMTETIESANIKTEDQMLRLLYFHNKEPSPVPLKK